MNRTSLALALAAMLSLSLTGCGEKQEAAQVQAEKAAPVAAATATATFEAQVAAFEKNNLLALLQSSLPQQQWEEAKADWERNRAEPITEEDRKEWADSWGKLTAPDGVDQIMAEVEPKLAEAKPQMAGMVAMMQGIAMMSVQNNQELTDAQKQQATSLLQGLSGWLNTTDFTDAAKMRAALTALADGMRATKIATLEDLHALSFEDLLAKGGVMLGAFKQSLDVYGLSLDQIAKSMKAEVLTETGDTAKLKVSYSLFGTPLSYESEMQRIDGKWYGKDLLAQIEKATAEAESEGDATAEADATDGDSDSETAATGEGEGES